MQQKAVFVHALGLSETSIIHHFADKTVFQHYRFFCIICKNNYDSIKEITIEADIFAINPSSSCPYPTILTVEKLEKKLGITLETSARHKIQVGIFRQKGQFIDVAASLSYVNVPQIVEPIKSVPLAPTVLKRIKTDTCVSCQMEEPNVIFSSCGHQCYCKDCVQKWNKHCPLCRVVNNSVIEF